MNKLEIIGQMASLLKRTNPNLKGKDVLTNAAYNDGIIDAMNEVIAHEINYAEYQPRAGGITASGADVDALNRYPKNIQNTVRVMRSNFTVGINLMAEVDIADAILNKNGLRAVKSYKEASNLCLRDAKRDIDKVRLKLDIITLAQYETMWS